MLLRRFNAIGLERFRNFVETLKSDKMLPAPKETDLLLNEELTVVVTPGTDVPDEYFKNRLAAAQYLDRVLTQAGLSAAFQDVELWAWLALRFFDQLRPLGPNISIKKLGVDAARFIPTDNYQDRHRHLLRHPLQVLRAYGEDVNDALCLLVQPVYQPGDVVEQFASRRMYSWYKQVIPTLSALVVDFGAMRIKTNASTDARRLDEVLSQFDCTWDLGFMDKGLLISMLPPEFEKSWNAPKASDRRRTKKRRVATGSAKAKIS